MKIWFLEERQAHYIPKVIPAPKWILFVRLFQLLGTCSVTGLTIWIIWAYGAGADLFINPPVLTLTTSAITLLSLPILAPIIPIFRPIYHSWLALALELLCSSFWIASATCLAVLCNFYTTLRGIAYVPYQPLAVSAAVYLTNSTCTNTTQTVSDDSLGYYNTAQLDNYLQDYREGKLSQTTYFTNQQSSPFLNASRAGWQAYRMALAAAILCGFLALAFFYTLCCYVWWFVQAYVANAASGTVEADGGGKFRVEKIEASDSPIEGSRGGWSNQAAASASYHQPAAAESRTPKGPLARAATQDSPTFSTTSLNKSTTTAGDGQGSPNGRKSVLQQRNPSRLTRGESGAYSPAETPIPSTLGTSDSAKAATTSNDVREKPAALASLDPSMERYSNRIPVAGGGGQVSSNPERPLSLEDENVI